MQTTFRIKRDSSTNRSSRQLKDENGGERQSLTRVDASLLSSRVRSRFEQTETGMQRFSQTQKTNKLSIVSERHTERESEIMIDISKLVGHFQCNKKANTLRYSKPAQNLQNSRESSIQPKGKPESLNVSYYQSKMQEIISLRKQKNAPVLVANKHSSMIRSKIGIFQMEKRINNKPSHKSNKVLQSHFESSTLPPRGTRHTVKFKDDENHNDEDEYRPSGLLPKFAYRKPVVSPEDMGSELVIHVKGRLSEKLQSRFSSKGNSELQLQHFILRDQLRQPEQVGNIFIDSFYEKGDPQCSVANIKKIENQIDLTLEKNLQSLKNYGSRICKRAHESISRIVEPNKTANQKYRHDLLMKMKDFLLFFKTLRLAPETILKFPIRPYTDSKSNEFMEAAKFGDSERVKELLYKFSSLLIYEFDYLHLTALHWAAKRNHTQCAAELILRKSYVNARDVYGRTPLYYAIQNKNPSLVYMLLVYKASPWSSKHVNYIDLAEDDENVIYYIKKFRFLDLILTFRRREERPEVRRNFVEKKVRIPKFSYLAGQYPDQ